jgi:6-pyruvoyl-tetrahydropterin synthase
LLLTSDALVKRKDFSMEHVVREKIEKEQKSIHGHDCVQVQQLQHEYEQQKVVVARLTYIAICSQSLMASVDGANIKCSSFEHHEDLLCII